jgi:hypothetical protein
LENHSADIKMSVDSLVREELHGSVATSLEKDQHELGNVVLQYPTNAFQALEQHEDSIWTILDQLQSMSVYCRVGYDYSCSWYTYLTEDDEDFFTGILSC